MLDGRYGPRCQAADGRGVKALIRSFFAQSPVVSSATVIDSAGIGFAGHHESLRSFADGLVQMLGIMRFVSRNNVPATAALAVVLTASAWSISTRPAVDLLVVQVPAGVESGFAGSTALFQPADWYVDGARIVLLPSSGGDPVVLTPEFAAACDPDVSFDGRSIVFAGKKEVGDSWQVWKMDADGSNKVQITREDGDNISPVFAGSRFYLNDPAPTPQIIFASTRHGWHNESGDGPAYALFATDHERQTVHRLTFNLNSDYSPDVLPNGRIVFSSMQGSGAESSADNRVALFAVNLDGTDLMPYYGNHEAPSFKGQVHTSDFDERVYFIETDNPGPYSGGEIAEVSQGRPLHSYRRLTFDQTGSYATPIALPDGGLLASFRANDDGAAFALYSLDPESGERLDLVYEEAAWHLIDAQVLTSRPQARGRSNWLIPGSTTGVFYSLNSYRTNLFEGENVPPGSIKHVRVIEGIVGARRLLGIAPVEQDGSFHIRVPAETPITFQLLDENYVALRSQRAWTWVIGNENRGCIGCHENRELSPPNRVVDAVMKPAVELTLPPERRRTVDFVNQIVPILRGSCATAGCHVSGAAAPDLEVDNDPRSVYETLIGPIGGMPDERYVSPTSARESPLIWALFGRRIGAEETRSSRVVMQMPPQGPLTLRERLLLTEWVDLGAWWDTREAVAAVSER